MYNTEFNDLTHYKGEKFILEEITKDKSFTNKAGFYVKDIKKVIRKTPVSTKCGYSLTKEETENNSIKFSSVAKCPECIIIRESEGNIMLAKKSALKYDKMSKEEVRRIMLF